MNRNFVQEIEDLCRAKNIEYIDAVITWCETNSIELEYAAAIIKKDPMFKSKLQIEAENLNFLKKSGSLPI
jgi:hypothetical protein